MRTIVPTIAGRWIHAVGPLGYRIAEVVVNPFFPANDALSLEADTDGIARVRCSCQDQLPAIAAQSAGEDSFAIHGKVQLSLAKEESTQGCRRIGHCRIADKAAVSPLAGEGRTTGRERLRRADAARLAGRNDRLTGRDSRTTDKEEESETREAVTGSKDGDHENPLILLPYA